MLAPLSREARAMLLPAQAGLFYAIGHGMSIEIMRVHAMTMYKAKISRWPSLLLLMPQSEDAHQPYVGDIPAPRRHRRICAKKMPRIAFIFR